MEEIYSSRYDGEGEEEKLNNAEVHALFSCTE